MPPVAADRDAPIGRDGAAAIVILLFASIDAAEWFRGRPMPLFAIRATWWVIAAGVVLRLVQRFGAAWVRALVAKQALLSAVLGIAVLSSTWSLAPSESLRESLSLVATTLMGAYIGCTLSPAALVRVLAIALSILIVSSLMALPILPDRIVVEPLTHQWRGLMDHKNSFGAVATLAVLVHAARMTRRRGWTTWTPLACALSVLALFLSRSITSLIACSAGVIALVWLVNSDRLSRIPARARIALSIAVVLLVLAAVVEIGPITRTLGRDPTFNGRTPLWAASLRIIRARPFTGYGYHVVWRKQAGSLLPQFPETMARSATSAHDAVLNAATEIGLPAAALFVAYIVAIVRGAIRVERQERSTFSLFAVVALVAMATTNLAESYWLSIHSMTWMVFVALAVVLRRAPPASPRLSGS